MGWYIFISIHFFEDNWKDIANTLYWANLILLIECIIFYIKWVLVIVVMIIFFLYCLIQWRMGRVVSNDKKNELKEILLSISKLKLKKKHYEPEDVWPIWCVEFIPDQNIIHLPWNAKHYFHGNWIGEWVSQSPCWPLCKSPITEELLKSFADNEKEQANEQQNTPPNEAEVEMRRAANRIQNPYVL